MNKITINTEGAQNLLQHLKPNKATGPDDIPAKLRHLSVGPYKGRLQGLVR
jgi:hypothetical protein